MDFESCLQNKKDQEAFKNLQDFEIRFLEHVKKCVIQKVKIEKDYSEALANLSNLFEKFEFNEFKTHLSQVQNFFII